MGFPYSFSFYINITVYKTDAQLTCLTLIRKYYKKKKKRCKQAYKNYLYVLNWFINWMDLFDLFIFLHLEETIFKVFFTILGKFQNFSKVTKFFQNVIKILKNRENSRVLLKFLANFKTLQIFAKCLENFTKFHRFFKIFPILGFFQTHNLSTFSSKSKKKNLSGSFDL